MQAPLIPDLLQRDLKLVFCGTALSAASYQAKAYYAKPGNQFWPALARTGITPHLFLPAEYERLLTLGIGLTDLCKTASGQDDALPKDQLRPDLFWQKMHIHQPKTIAFTSKNAASIALGHKVEYGLQAHKQEGADIFVLPSPSGLARRWWREDIWQGLSDHLHRGC